MIAGLLGLSSAQAKVPPWATVDGFVDPQKPAKVSPVLAPVQADRYRYRLDSFPDSIFFTFAPDTRPVGAAYDSLTKDHETYVKEVFRRIVFEADRLARNHFAVPYVEGSHQNYAYYTFMVTALAVPHHESHLMHIRKTKGDRCVPGMNNLTKTLASTRAELEPHYRNPNDILMPNCDAIKDNDEVYQILGSGTTEGLSADISIMQLNPYSHEDIMAPHYLLSLPKTLEYGVNYLYSGKTVTVNPDHAIGGYELLLSNYKKLACADSFAKDLYGASNTRSSLYATLPGGVWRGQYNRGYYKRACSYFDGSIYSRGFERSFLSIVKTDSSLWHRYLPKGSLERAAFEEIVANYRAIFLKGYNEQTPFLGSITGHGRAFIKAEMVAGDPEAFLNKYLEQDNNLSEDAAQEKVEDLFVEVIPAERESPVILNVLGREKDQLGRHWYLVETKEEGREGYIYHSRVDLIVQEQNQNLNRVLKQEQRKQPTPWKKPARRRLTYNYKYLLAEGETPIYRRLQEKPQYRCGHLESFQGNPTDISVQRVIQRGEGRMKWALVEIPEYAPFTEHYSIEAGVALKPGVSAVNVRSSMEVTPETKLGQLRGSESLRYVDTRTADDGDQWFVGIDNSGQEVFVHSAYTERRDTRVKPKSNECFADEYFVPLDLLRIIYEPGRKYIGQIVGNGRAFIKSQMIKGQVHLIETVPRDRPEPVTYLVTGGERDDNNELWYLVETSEEQHGYIHESRLELLRYADDSK